VTSSVQVKLRVKRGMALQEASRDFLCLVGLGLWI
jgi:hypothetical protein